MAIGWQDQLRPGKALRAIVQQATAALVAMNADRLEELALCCADLNRGDFNGCDDNGTSEANGEDGSGVTYVQSAQQDLELLRCILVETRANLTVLSRLHTVRLRESARVPHRSAADPGKIEINELAALSPWERTPDYGDN